MIRLLLFILILILVISYESDEAIFCEKIGRDPVVKGIDVTADRVVFDQSEVDDDQIDVLAEPNLVLVGEDEYNVIETDDEIIVATSEEFVVTSVARIIPDFLNHAGDYLDYYGPFDFSQAVDVIIRKKLDISTTCPVSIQESAHIYFWLSNYTLADRLSSAESYIVLDELLALYEKNANRITVIFNNKNLQNLRIVTYTSEVRDVDVEMMKKLINAYALGF